MKLKFKAIATAMAVTALAHQAAQASFLGLPRVLKYHFASIHVDAPTLPPMAHTIFCMQYPQDCKVHRVIFRGGPLAMTPARWQELVKVNAEVNRSIMPEPNLGGIATERWLIAPTAGDCNDYAVTKRHELLVRGWPARALLLAEVVTTWGEHHLVLVIRTRDGDLVADNLNANIRQWVTTRYQWVRIQSPENPVFWSRVAPAVGYPRGTWARSLDERFQNSNHMLLLKTPVFAA
jgi:predicted transglutaminase-like cysteine proteinase